jgi:DNA-binding response OmpR family regulator
MTARASILVVEDEENLRTALRDNLVDEGYAVRLAADGAQARRELAAGPVDLVVLDLMLPDTNGYELARGIRAAKNPAMILMLTARTLEEDIVRGFEAGADDYVPKPYRLAELLARVKALVRRGQSLQGTAPAASGVTFAGFRLDRTARTLTAPDGGLVELTKTEFDLLGYLLDNRDRALSRQEILDAVWGADVVVDGRTIDNFVSNLKKKLHWTPSSAFQIRTLRGIGYRFELA